MSTTPYLSPSLSASLGGNDFRDGYMPIIAPHCKTYLVVELHQDVDENAPEADWNNVRVALSSDDGVKTKSGVPWGLLAELPDLPPHTARRYYTIEATEEGEYSLKVKASHIHDRFGPVSKEFVFVAS